MLAGVNPALDRAVVLFQNVIQVRHRSMPAILLKGTFGFEPLDRGRVRAVTVGVDDSRHGMVLPSQRFGQEALCCGRVLLGREQEVDRRAGRIHRTIQVAPLALDPNVGFVHPPTIVGRLESRAQTFVPFPGRNAAPTSRR